jgi:hypothetical protein
LFVSDYTIIAATTHSRHAFDFEIRRPLITITVYRYHFSGLLIPFDAAEYGLKMPPANSQSITTRA